MAGETEPLLLKLKKKKKKKPATTKIFFKIPIRCGVLFNMGKPIIKKKFYQKYIYKKQKLESILQTVLTKVIDPFVILLIHEYR